MSFFFYVQVNGINQWRLGALRHYLTVGNTLDGAAGNTLNNGTVISTPSQNSSQHMNGKPLGGYIPFEIVSRIRSAHVKFYESI
jgi:hypothetical protein